MNTCIYMVGIKHARNVIFEYFMPITVVKTMRTARKTKSPPFFFLQVPFFEGFPKESSIYTINRNEKKIGMKNRSEKNTCKVALKVHVEC